LRTGASRTGASHPGTRQHEPVVALAAFAVLPFVWMATMAALTGGRRLMVEHGSATAASAVAARTDSATLRASSVHARDARPTTSSRETAPGVRAVPARPR
jgi:hypothetical protein